MVAPSQIIPRYRLATPGNTQGGVFDNSSDNRSDGNGALHGAAASDGRIYIDNILDEALTMFREHYQDSKIVKDDIFHYVYGILHHPGYRDKYKNDLFKELPRIPFAPDFWAFSEAGEQLAYIHANYDQLDGWEGKMKVEYSDDFDPDNREHWRIEKMRWTDDNKTLKFNDHITLRNIPAGAHIYKIADNSPIQEFAKQIIRKEYDDSGIVNDRNDLFNHNPPEVLLRARQLIEVGVKTSEILVKLPATFETMEESKSHSKKVS